MTIATIFAQQVHAQYYSVNFDAKTVAAMVAAYGTGTVAEAYYDEQVQNILKHYKASEVATAGIFASKFLERKALTDLGIWSSATENYYSRRIYHLVAHKIIPKTWIVAKLMLRSPQTHPEKRFFLVGKLQGRSSGSFLPQRLPGPLGPVAFSVSRQLSELTAAGTAADFHGIPI